MKDTLIDLVKELRQKCMEVGYHSHDDDLDYYLTKCDEAEVVEETLINLIRELI
jgi:hypothetical protein